MKRIKKRTLITGILLLLLIFLSCTRTTINKYQNCNFTAIRLLENPIINKNMPGLEGVIGNNINGPSLIRVPNWIGNPLGKYYLYFAHHRGKYIRLAYADNITGPWSIYRNGTLKLEQTKCIGHIASPDVHVDKEKKKIFMYFHGDGCNEKNASNIQSTLVATSSDGINFVPSSQVLGQPYFRVFQHDGYYYALAQDNNKGGILLRSKEKDTKFEKVINIIPKMRHSAVLLKNNTLLIFYSNIGDTPERILLSSINLSQNWHNWRPSPPITLLRPEKGYEGVGLPLTSSQHGPAMKPVQQLRDPAIYVEGNETYLLYSVAGEQGIAVARLVKQCEEQEEVISYLMPIFLFAN